MRGEELLEKMELADLQYVEAAETAAKPKRIGWIRFATAAACLAAAAAAGILLLPREPAELPLLTIAEDTNSGMGFEGYTVHDISELTNGNPWNEDMVLTTLPVYRNPLTYVDNRPSGADFEQMEDILLDTAGRLGMDTAALTVTDNAPDEDEQKAITEKYAEVGSTVPAGCFDPTELSVRTRQYELTIDLTQTIDIRFKPRIPLPEGLLLSDSAEYLMMEYAALMDFKQPQLIPSGGDSNMDQLSFYDGAGNDVQRIVNYNFFRVSFLSSTLARITMPDLSDKAGDYPVISLEEAKSLLESGHYITTVPCELPGMEYAAKAELVYRTGSREDYFMPYYRFYVELPEWEENGLKTYGAYYVPAVSGEYLAEMPVWDGSFN